MGDRCLETSIYQTFLDLHSLRRHGINLSITKLRRWKSSSSIDQLMLGDQRHLHTLAFPASKPLSVEECDTKALTGVPNTSLRVYHRRFSFCPSSHLSPVNNLSFHLKSLETTLPAGLTTSYNHCPTSKSSQHYLQLLSPANLEVRVEHHPAASAIAQPP
jgi:hypothetical protein